MREIQMRGVIRTVRVDVEAIALPLAIRNRHCAPLPHVNRIAKKRRIMFLGRGRRLSSGGRRRKGFLSVHPYEVRRGEVFHSLASVSSTAHSYPAAKASARLVM